VSTPHASHRRTRRLVTLASAAIAALAVGVLPATQAHATPTPQEVEAQIDTLWGTLEPLVEQYNGVHYQLTQNQAKQAALLKQMGLDAVVKTSAGTLSRTVSRISSSLPSGSPVAASSSPSK